MAWIYHTGDTDSVEHTQIQTNPIIVDGVLYGVSSRMKLFALDAATGKEKWLFQIKLDKPEASPWSKNKRGVTYWEDAEARKTQNGVTTGRGTGRVYIPTGAVSTDLYGGGRKGSFFPNILALDTASGVRIWHLQTIHHKKALASASRQITRARVPRTGFEPVLPP